MNHRKPKGFTIVELLVVIAIILTLAGIIFAIGSSWVRKSRATVMSTNMKQMSSFFAAYATDNQQLMMPCRGDVVQNDGSIDPDALWHEIILSMMYEDTDPARFKQDDYWEGNDHFLRNPLFQADDAPRGFGPLNPGYGYNLMLPENYELAENGSVPGDVALEYVRVPMPFIDEPGRTPIIAPADNYFYRYDDDQIDEFDTGTIRNFLVNDQFPVLFMDGSVERMKPSDYINRRLPEMPLDELNP